MADEESIDNDGLLPYRVAGLHELGEHGQSLIDAVLRCHGSIRFCLRKTLLVAKSAGEHLATLKEMVGHGEWEEWADATFPEIKKRTRQTYMRIAAHWEERLAELFENGDISTISEALARLSSPIPLKAERLKNSRYSPDAPLYDQLASIFRQRCQFMHYEIQEYYLENFDEIMEAVEIELERRHVEKAQPTALLVPWVVDPLVYG